MPNICPQCGTEFSGRRCPQCEAPNGSTEGDATGGIIPYKNPPALIAYYLGLFSLFPVLGFFLGVAALVLGIIGLKKRQENPAVKGSVHAWIGIGCGTVTALFWGATIVIAIVALVSHG
jgi:hypothetical protein